MVLQIYQVVLMTLMFVFSLTSFSIMIASLTKYLKNKSKKDLEIEITTLKNDINFFTIELSQTQDVNKIKELSDKLSDAKTKLSSLEAKKK